MTAKVDEWNRRAEMITQRNQAVLLVYEAAELLSAIDHPENARRLRFLARVDELYPYTERPAT